MAHFEKLDEKHPYYAIAAFRMSQKPEVKEVTVARFYWKFAAFNFISKRWNEMFMCVRLMSGTDEELALRFSTVALQYFTRFSDVMLFTVIYVYPARIRFPKNFSTYFFLFLLSQSLIHVFMSFRISHWQMPCFWIVTIIKSTKCLKVL